jgi:hypothetical protein
MNLAALERIVAYSEIRQFPIMGINGVNGKVAFHCRPRPNDGRLDRMIPFVESLATVGRDRIAGESFSGPTYQGSNERPDAP